MCAENVIQSSRMSLPKVRVILSDVDRVLPVFIGD